MPRNLILCFDGTNNQFGPENTNVVRLIQALDRDPARQRLYYDGGVGTLPEPGALTAFGQWLSKVGGLLLGGGIEWKVEEAYRFLMEMWMPDDRVLIFGFSRGAYSARMLAGMLYALGLLPRGCDNLVPYVMRLYKSLRGSSADVDAYRRLCAEFRLTFARTVPAPTLHASDPIVEADRVAEQRHLPVHFLGLWDTVSSVGWAWDPQHYPYTANNRTVDVVRHAISIDERRWFFRENVLQQAFAEQDLQERWFPGVHSDVGGGYPEPDSGLWRGPFLWIVQEAMTAGLRIDHVRYQQVLQRTPVSTTPWDDPQHESLHGWWWVAEYYPKRRWNAATRRTQFAIGRGRHRTIPAGAQIHEWALRRLRETAYRPANLTPSFVQRVQALPQVPASMPYAP